MCVCGLGSLCSPTTQPRANIPLSDYHDLSDYQNFIIHFDIVAQVQYRE